MKGGPRRPGARGHAKLLEENACAKIMTRPKHCRERPPKEPLGQGPRLPCRLPFYASRVVYAAWRAFISRVFQTSPPWLLMILTARSTSTSLPSVTATTIHP